MIKRALGPGLLALLMGLNSCSDYNFKSITHETIREGENLSLENPDEDYVIANANLVISFSASGSQHAPVVKANIDHFYEMISLKDMQEFVFHAYTGDKTKIDNVKAAYGSRGWYTPLYTEVMYEDEAIFHSGSKIGYFTAQMQAVGTHFFYKYDEVYSDVRYLPTIYLNESYPLEQKTITFKVPRGIEVEVIGVNTEGYDITRIDSVPRIAHRKRCGKVPITSWDSEAPYMKKFTYVIKNLKPARKDAYSAGPSYTLPHLRIICKEVKEVPFMNSVSDQYTWYMGLVGKIGNKPDSIKSLAKELTVDKETDIERIKAVYYWVQDNIRYIAFEEGLAGFRPEACQRVLANRYADCKGMANLTREMLVSLGYDARLVWIGTRHIAYDYSVPSLAVDNHMICMVNLEGKRYFLDPTEKYIAFGNYAYRIQGKQAMVENGESYLLDTIPDLKYTGNKDKSVFHLTINKEKLVGQAHVEKEGDAKVSFLQSYNNIKSDRREAVLERYLTNSSAGLMVNSVEHSNLNYREGNIILDYAIEALGQVVIDKERILIQGDLHRDFESLEIDTNTQYQVDFGTKMYEVIETHINIPANYQVKTLPDALNIDRKYYQFTGKYIVEGNELLYQRSIIIKEGYVPLQYIYEWNKDVNTLRNFYNQYVVIHKN